VSARIVEFLDPLEAIDDLLDSIREIWTEIPCRDSCLDVEEERGVERVVVADWPGASPEGYRYAPESQEELLEALQLLQRAAQTLRSVSCREWPRCGNGANGETYEQFKRDQARRRAERERLS
jgi:hypothetical protein